MEMFRLKGSVRSNVEKLHNIFEDKLKNFFQELNHVFNDAKYEFIKKAEVKFAEIKLPIIAIIFVSRM